MADAIEIFTSSASERIEVITSGAQGPQGPAGPAGATFDQDLNTTDAVTFASVNAPLYDAALGQPGAGVDDAVFSIYAADGTAKLDASGMTGTRLLALPDESGTLALVANTATAAQGALADTAVQPNSAPTFFGLDIIDDNPSVRVAQSAISGDDVVVNDLSVKFGDGTYTHTLQRQGTLAANATFTLPVSTGTLALTSQIPTTFAASAISDSTTAGRALLTAADASAQRTSLGLGTFATANAATPPAIGGTTPAAGAFTSLSGTSLSAASGTITASAPFDFSQTWNNAAVTFTGLKFNVTDTASNAASLLLDLQVGGATKASIRKDGTIYTASQTALIGTNGAIYQDVSGAKIWIFSNTAASGGSSSAGALLVRDSGTFVNSSALIGWSSSANNLRDNAADLALYRDAANTLAQRNGTNAQEARVYATYTSATNYQRGTVKCVKQTLSALSGASATTTGTFIPDGAVVVGVTTRVGTAITGATSYSVGDGSDIDRWGGSIGVALNTTSDNRDWTAGTVECFTSGGNVTLTANGSNFTGGAVEICVFYLAGEAD